MDRRRGDRGHARDRTDVNRPLADRVPQIGRRQPVEIGESASKVIHHDHQEAVEGGAGRG
jgi:hypothetical protein